MVRSAVKATGDNVDDTAHPVEVLVVDGLVRCSWSGCPGREAGDLPSEGGKPGGVAAAARAGQRRIEPWSMVRIACYQPKPSDTTETLRRMVAHQSRVTSTAGRR